MNAFTLSRKLLAQITLLSCFLYLVACSRAPLSTPTIKIVSVDPEPIVGEVSIVTVQIVDTALDRSNVEVTGRFGVRNEPKTIWEGALKKNESQTINFSLCISEPSKNQLRVGVEAFTDDSRLGGNVDWVGITSDYNSAEVNKQINPAHEIRIDPNTATPLPPTGKEPSLSPECLGADMH